VLVLGKMLVQEPGDAQLRSQIESILLVAGGPVSIRELARVLDEPQNRVSGVLKELQSSLEDGIQLQLLDGQAQLVTAPENSGIVQRFLGTSKAPPLSRSALETLTFIAYRQPSTRPEIEVARGVNSDRVVQTLLARELIEERGRRETLGRPMEYGTTFGFLEYFGLRSLEDLPEIEGEDGGVVDGTRLGMRES
jgi:segregation and condensation protein B